MMLFHIQLVNLLLLARRVILCSPQCSTIAPISAYLWSSYFMYHFLFMLHFAYSIPSVYCIFSACDLSVTDINSIGLTRLGRNSVLLTDSAKAEDTFIHYYYYTISTETSVSLATTTTPESSVIACKTNQPLRDYKQIVLQ